MSHRTLLRGLGIAAALAAGAALGDDSTSRLLLERAQRADAYTLREQHAMDSARAGTLGPRERLELDARQRDQRRQQDALFYRQQIGTHTPATDIQRRTETMRGEQERQEQLSRFRFESGSTPAGTPPAPAPGIAPTIEAAPIPRASTGATELPRAQPDQPQALTAIRRAEYEAATLWQAALAGDWSAAQGALDDVRGSVDALRGVRFKAEYAASGGRLDLLCAVLDRLDAAISGAETRLGTRDAGSLMGIANELLLTAAELVPDIAPTRTPASASQGSNRPPRLPAR
jgi:hypothetical protein